MATAPNTDPTGMASTPPDANSFNTTQRRRLQHHPTPTASAPPNADNFNATRHRQLQRHPTPTFSTPPDGNKFSTDQPNGSFKTELSIIGPWLPLLPLLPSSVPRVLILPSSYNSSKMHPQGQQLCHQ
jgi:hypothetical protein